jgi:plasmid replication initiation protein
MVNVKLKTPVCVGAPERVLLLLVKAMPGGKLPVTDVCTLVAPEFVTLIEYR